jgi:hypothetical protein
MDDIVDTEGSGVSSPSAVTTDMVTTINTATATRALVELRRCGGFSFGFVQTWVNP